LWLVRPPEALGRNMREFFSRAIKNITKHGDTDIFPFPIENHVFFDKPDEVIERLLDLDKNFAERLVQFPPAHEGALAPVNYVGFRWATQLARISHRIRCIGA
jgi:hypothetical protein